MLNAKLPTRVALMWHVICGCGCRLVVWRLNADSIWQVIVFKIQNIIECIHFSSDCAGYEVSYPVAVLSCAEVIAVLAMR